MVKKQELCYTHSAETFLHLVSMKKLQKNIQKLLNFMKFSAFF